MFLINDKLVWRDKTSYKSPGTMVQMMHVNLMFLQFLRILKSSFSEDNMPEHALDILIENATKLV